MWLPLLSELLPWFYLKYFKISVENSNRCTAHTISFDVQVTGQTYVVDHHEQFCLLVQLHAMLPCRYNSILNILNNLNFIYLRQWARGIFLINFPMCNTSQASTFVVAISLWIASVILWKCFEKKVERLWKLVKRNRWKVEISLKRCIWPFSSKFLIETPIEIASVNF